MIEKFVSRFDAAREQLAKQFAVKHPRLYLDIVKAVVETLRDPDEPYDSPDPERIHTVDDGDYQGTLLFVIGAGGYQPSTYWTVKVGYGSCSGCDTLEGIRNYSDDPPTEEQVKQYMTLVLHVVQGLHKVP